MMDKYPELRDIEVPSHAMKNVEPFEHVEVALSISFSRDAKRARRKGSASMRSYENARETWNDLRDRALKEPGA